MLAVEVVDIGFGPGHLLGIWKQISKEGASEGGAQ